MPATAEQGPAARSRAWPAPTSSVRYLGVFSVLCGPNASDRSVHGGPHPPGSRRRLALVPDHAGQPTLQREHLGVAELGQDERGRGAAFAGVAVDDELLLPVEALEGFLANGLFAARPADVVIVDGEVRR